MHLSIKMSDDYYFEALSKLNEEKGINKIEVGGLNYKLATKPPASIIVRSFNGEKYLESAVESIVENTWESLEIILVYDRSTTDNTLSKIDNIIKKFENNVKIKIKIVFHDRASPFRSLVVGIENIDESAEFVFFLDYDNIFYKNRIEETIKIMKDKNIEFSFCNQDLIDELGNIHGKFLTRKPIVRLENCINSNFIDINSIAIRSDFLKGLMKYIHILVDKTYDWIFEDWLIGMISLGTLDKQNIFIEERMGGYRTHSGNITRVKAKTDSNKTILNLERNIRTYIAINFIIDNYSDDFEADRFRRIKTLIYLEIENGELKYQSRILSREFFFETLPKIPIKLISSLFYKNK